MDGWALIAERRILEAMEEGRFDDLAGKYKPLSEEEPSSVPADMRLGLKVLKNAGVLPPEMQVRKEAAALQAAVLACRDPAEKAVLERELAMKRLQYSVMVERRR